MSDETPSRIKIPEENDPHYGVVGLIAAYWAALERHVDIIIWALCQCDPNKLACVTAQLNGFHPRFRALIALFREHGLPESEVRKLNKFMNDSEPMLDKRNRIVHDPYMSSDEGRSMLRYTIRANKRLVRTWEPTNLEEMREFATELGFHVSRFAALSNDCLDALGIEIRS